MRRTSPERKRVLSRGGSSLIEVLVAMVIFTVAAASYAGAVATTSQSSLQRRTISLAAAAARDMVERIRATPASQRFAAYNADIEDDPNGPGTAFGARFAVADLPLAEGDPDGFAGEIEFPVTDGMLREDSTDAKLGMPRDLNGDTLIDKGERNGDYVILPVRVRVVFQVRGATREFEVHTELVNWGEAAP